MSLEDKERLERELKERVMGNLQSRDEIGNLIRFTLKNFSYRYIESDTTGLGEPIESGDSIFIELQESTLAQALKTQNKETRQGLIELAKSFSKKDNPAVCYRLGVNLNHLNSQGGGEFKIFAEVNWDFPNFDPQSSKKNLSQQTTNYENGFELRNDLARVLEEVCDIF